MKLATFTCVECGKQFEREAKYSHSVTCGSDCARSRHTQKVRERRRVEREPTDVQEMDEARVLRDFLAPLNELVRQQGRAVKVAGWWR